MKIAIINLTGGKISGGYKKYLVNIVPRLASDANIDSILCVSPASLNLDGWFERIRNVEFISCESFHPLRYKLNNETEKKIRRFSPDVIFVPIERPVKFYGIPVVVMVQNMEPFVFGIDEYSLLERMRCFFQRVIGKKAVKDAVRVIAISKFVRDFLVNTWHIPKDDISLIYHGLSPDKNVTPIRPEDVPREWIGRFIFTAGSIRPARGLEDLIFCAKNMDLSALGVCGIVLAGGTSTGMLRYKQRLIKLIKANDLSDKFIFLDEIDSSQMVWCYKNCRLFVATSRVESFGMIGLEAMAHGCLCVAADSPCLPEIFRDCALYYKTKDLAGLAKAIDSILRMGDSEKNIMSQKAQARAAEFSWERTSNMLVKEFQSAAATSKNMMRRTTE